MSTQESTMIESVTARVTAKMLATPVTDFMTPDVLAKHPTFTSMKHFAGFTFYHETELKIVNALSGTVGMFMLNSDIKDDHSYAFFPNLGERVSPLLLLSILKVLNANGYHVATAYHQMLFGIKTPA
jgi:hypothetical protein